MKITYTAKYAGGKPSETCMPILRDAGDIDLYTKDGWVVIGNATITVDYLKPEEIELASRVSELESEVLDQCRLNGMGAERELALMGRVAELEAALQGFYRNSNRHDWPADIYDAATAALTANTSGADHG